MTELTMDERINLLENEIEKHRQIVESLDNPEGLIGAMEAKEYNEGIIEGLEIALEIMTRIR